MEQVHLLIKNAKVFNSYLKKFISANVAVKDGKFYYIDRKQDTDLQTDNVIDAKGSYMIPGLTDIHMHIESSMATPAFFGKCIAGKEINLTAKEFDVLELLVFNPNKVYSRENLLNIVWGYEYPGDVRTVDVHIRRLREKIEANPSEPKYVHTKWGVGYYFQA